MKIKLFSKILLLFTAIILATSMQFPIWQIDLDAPQYPEGLKLLIYADEIGGDVDIINGLNHYIGMKTLHTEDFFEFSILTYILYAFSGLSLLVMLAGRKNLLYILFSLFVVFGVVAMVDFWHWEYNYGHNLDPNAAIIVPGMAYQPPLIGFKQLLNFGAYSIPHTGGWMLLGSGILLLIATVFETGIWKRFQKKAIVPAASMLLLLVHSGCGAPTSRPIQLNKDVCANCKMTISDLKFSAEAVNNTNKVYTFDDIQCLMHFSKQEPKLEEAHFYVADFESETSFLLAKDAWYVSGGKLSSPMGGNTAAFHDKSTAEKFASEQGGNLESWEQVKAR